MDEKTPHIHATVVPIVRGKRRKAKQQQVKNNGKRTYRKKKDGPRLCADDVMSRPKLKEYQTTYAEAMAKYGLKRGIDGSEAKHITGSQFYREVFMRRNEIAQQVEAMVGQKETLSVDIAALQAQREAARTELAQTRREIKTDKLKGAAVDATTKAVERIGALFHDLKPARYEKQIAELQVVIADRDNKIKDLQREIETMRAGHEQEKAELKQQKQEVLKALMRIDYLFPHVKGLLKWEDYCKTVGLNKARTKALFTMQPHRYTGELYSIRYNQTFKADNVVLQFKPDKDGPAGFRFTINGKDDSQWFRQKNREFQEKLGINVCEKAEQRNRKI